MMKKELSKSEAIRLHRKMWNWIADKTLERKSIVGRYDYTVETKNPVESTPFLGSYCCEYANQKLERSCKHCPLDWKSKVDSCMCVDKYEMDDDNGLLKKWVKWVKEKDYKKCVELAREIANLPEKI